MPVDRPAPRTTWWLATAVAAGLVTIAVVVLWRGFPWMTALFSGGAVGVLAYMTLHTIERVRGQWR